MNTPAFLPDGTTLNPEWLNTRRTARTITPNRKPRARTLAGYAKAWNVSPETLLTAWTGMTKGETKSV